jgi:hypothetical protein
MSFVLRGAEVETAGGKRTTVSDANTAPCRRCLTDAQPGEDVVLVSYDPFTVDSPYRSASPVFVHAKNCARYEGAAIPEQQRRRLLSVRSFDADAMMREADVVDGTDLDAAIEKMFADDAVEFIHVHNAKPGCFAVHVARD